METGTNDIRKVATKVVEKQPIDVEYSSLKLEVIQKAIKSNEDKKESKTKRATKESNILPLLNIREKASKSKIHPYELMKNSGYIKSPIDEFLLRDTH